MPSEVGATTYGRVAKVLHWLMAAWIVTAYTVIIWLTWDHTEGLIPGLNYHKVIGFTILVPFIVRVVWRLANGAPALPDGMPLWQARLSRLTHALLYFLMVAMPVTGYLGNFGRHLAGQPLNINTIPKELLSRTEIPIRLRRPFTIFGGDQATVTSQEDNYGISNYHAFTLRLERRWNNGVSFTLAYTLSKWIDNISFLAANARTFGDNDNPQDIYNRAAERSLATNHIPHRLVVAPVIEGHEASATGENAAANRRSSSSPLTISPTSTISPTCFASTRCTGATRSR